MAVPGWGERGSADSISISILKLKPFYEIVTNPNSTKFQIRQNIELHENLHPRNFLPVRYNKPIESFEMVPVKCEIGSRAQTQ